MRKEVGRTARTRSAVVGRSRWRGCSSCSRTEAASWIDRVHPSDMHGERRHACLVESESHAMGHLSPSSLRSSRAAAHRAWLAQSRCEWKAGAKGQSASSGAFPQRCSAFRDCCCAPSPVPSSVRRSSRALQPSSIPPLVSASARAISSRRPSPIPRRKRAAKGGRGVRLRRHSFPAHAAPGSLSSSKSQTASLRPCRPTRGTILSTCRGSTILTSRVRPVWPPISISRGASCMREEHRLLDVSCDSG